MHFGEATLFDALQRLRCELTAKAGEKLQGRELVGIDNLKNNLNKPGENKRESSALFFFRFFFI